jgi:large subunit ribosomal protein L14
MIFVGTLLKVIDNSGAHTARCIKLYKGSANHGALIGDQILVSVRHLVSTKKTIKVKKSGLYRALIVRTSKEVCRKDGMLIKMDSNAIVLINPNGNPIGTRIRGPIFKEIRDLQFLKIASIAQGLI